MVYSFQREVIAALILNATIYTTFFLLQLTSFIVDNNYLQSFKIYVPRDYKLIK